MKKLSVIGMILGVGSLLLSLYLMFVLVPAAKVAEADMMRMASVYPIGTDAPPLFENPEYAAAFEISEKPIDQGTIFLFVSIAALLLCVYPAIKKDKLGILGAVCSLAAVLISAAYATHMFS